MKKLSGYCRSFLYSLWRKRDYFSKRGMLNEDGSFYYDDKRLAEELGCKEKTVMRCKRFSKDNGYIKYKSGTSRGNATKYWILRKPDNLSLKAPQNVTPNKEITNIINKEDFNNSSKDKDLKDGIKALAELKGVAFAKTFFINRGFSEAEVEGALGGEGLVKRIP